MLEDLFKFRVLWDQNDRWSQENTQKCSFIESRWEFALNEQRLNILHVELLSDCCSGECSKNKIENCTLLDLPYFINAACPTSIPCFYSL